MVAYAASARLLHDAPATILHMVVYAVLDFYMTHLPPSYMVVYAVLDFYMTHVPATILHGRVCSAGLNTSTIHDTPATIPHGHACSAIVYLHLFGASDINVSISSAVAFVWPILLTLLHPFF